MMAVVCACRAAPPAHPPGLRRPAHPQGLQPPARRPGPGPRLGPRLRRRRRWQVPPLSSPSCVPLLQAFRSGDQASLQQALYSGPSACPVCRIGLTLVITMISSLSWGCCTLRRGLGFQYSGRQLPGSKSCIGGHQVHTALVASGPEACASLHWALKPQRVSRLCRGAGPLICQAECRPAGNGSTTLVLEVYYNQARNWLKQCSGTTVMLWAVVGATQVTQPPQVTLAADWCVIWSNSWGHDGAAIGLTV